MDVAGTDATEAFEDVGHSDEARAILAGLQVGKLKRQVRCSLPFVYPSCSICQPYSPGATLLTIWECSLAIRCRIPPTTKPRSARSRAPAAWARPSTRSSCSAVCWRSVRTSTCRSSRRSERCRMDVVDTY